MFINYFISIMKKVLLKKIEIPPIFLYGQDEQYLNELVNEFYNFLLIESDKIYKIKKINIKNEEIYLDNKYIKDFFLSNSSEKYCNIYLINQINTLNKEYINIFINNISDTKILNKNIFFITIKNLYLINNKLKNNFFKFYISSKENLDIKKNFTKLDINLLNWFKKYENILNNILNNTFFNDIKEVYNLIYKLEIILSNIKKIKNEDLKLKIYEIFNLINIINKKIILDTYIDNPKIKIYKIEKIFEDFLSNQALLIKNFSPISILEKLILSLINIKKITK